MDRTSFDAEMLRLKAISPPSRENEDARRFAFAEELYLSMSTVNSATFRRVVTEVMKAHGNQRWFTMREFISCYQRVRVEINAPEEGKCTRCEGNKHIFARITYGENGMLLPGTGVIPCPRCNQNCGVGNSKIGMVGVPEEEESPREKNLRLARALSPRQAEMVLRRSDSLGRNDAWDAEALTIVKERAEGYLEEPAPEMHCLTTKPPSPFVPVTSPTEDDDGEYPF